MAHHIDELFSELLAKRIKEENNNKHTSDQLSQSGCTSYTAAQPYN